MLTNPFEEYHRLNKAIRLFRVLKRYHVPVSQVEHMTDEQWGYVARAAKVTPPRETTRLTVVVMLRSFEQLKKKSLFGGFGKVVP